MPNLVGFLYCEVLDACGSTYWVGCLTCKSPYTRWIERHPGGQYRLWDIWDHQLGPFGQTCAFCGASLASGGELFPRGRFEANTPESVADGQRSEIALLGGVL